MADVRTLPMMASTSQLASVEGLVFDIQRYSVHDGPGIRTNVFLKGCPLRCQWCANPESQQRHPELALRVHECMDCGLYETTCLLQWQNSPSSEERAALLGPRVPTCPTGAVHWIGRHVTSGEVIEEIRRDEAFYGKSGGMTLTGGEPLMQPAFCEALLRLASAEHISTAIETSGFASPTVLDRLLPYLDTVLFDVKHVDTAKHQRYTGVDNGRILSNLRRLVAEGAPITVRVPLIPEFNTDDAALQGLADLLLSMDGGPPPVDLLPYHALGRPKYAMLGREYPWQSWTRLDKGVAEHAADLLRGRGLIVGAQ